MVGSATASFAARLPSGSPPGPGPHTVGESAKDLGRSAGAVGNALTTLADRAEASRLTGKPIRYEANAAARPSYSSSR
jgi:hypothetical protein